jgi:hypothetical protein
MKGQKFGRRRDKACHWTPELDDILKSAWARGGLRAARRAIHQRQPNWSTYSIKKRAITFHLCRSRPLPWTQPDIDHMLWAIDSNASLTLIAERLGRTVGAVRHKLRALGYTVESLGGYKAKELAEMLLVPVGRVRYWVVEKLLLTKGGRITESSFSKFLAEHPKKIPFDNLKPEMQLWLQEMGYPVEACEPKTAKVGK